MKTISTFLIDMGKTEATMETWTGLIFELNAELAASENWREALNTHTGNNFIETVASV